MIPRYNSNEFNFQDLLKQVFWLISSDEYAKGNNPPHSFKGLDKSILKTRTT